MRLARIASPDGPAEVARLDGDVAVILDAPDVVSAATV
jgi:hypothetical protein